MPIEVPGGTETILVVEDDMHVRPLIVNRLGRLGYKVLEAASGAEALELPRGSRDQIDLVLIDLGLRDMSGVEVVGRLRQVRTGVRAVYISSSRYDVITHHGLRVPESRLLRQPFTFQDLARLLRHALEEE